MPANEPERLKIAELTPTSRPALSKSGPPELPGLKAASVWITLRIGRLFTDSISRPNAETTPVVSDWSRPNGLPMANTFWPTCKSFDVPTGTGGSLARGARYLQHREIFVRIGPPNLGLVGGLVVEGHPHVAGDGAGRVGGIGAGTHDDMAVRHNAPLFAPDKAGAGAQRNGFTVAPRLVRGVGERRHVNDGRTQPIVEFDGRFFAERQVAARASTRTGSYGGSIQ